MDSDSNITSTAFQQPSERTCETATFLECCYIGLAFDKGNPICKGDLRYLLRAIRQFDQDGKLVNNCRMLELGFEVGLHVIRKADEVETTIEDIMADEIQLVLADGKVVRVSSESFVAGKWKAHKPKQEPVPLMDWWKHSPKNCPDFALAGVRGMVMTKLMHQYGDFKQEKLVDIYVKPSKEVRVTKALDAEVLRIPVTSARVDIRKSGQDPPHGGLLLGKVAAVDMDYLVYVLPAFQPPKDGGSGGFLSPAWAMKVSADRSECNMELKGPSKVWSRQKLSAEKADLLLPVVTNFRKLAKGDSLVLFRPELAKAEPVEALQPVAKRTRKA